MASFASKTTMMSNRVAFSAQQRSPFSVATNRGGSSKAHQMRSTIDIAVSPSSSQPVVKCSSSRRVACRAASAAPAAPAVANKSPAQTKQYYALVANAEFFFHDVQNESLAEQLRERVRFHKEKGTEIDFHLVPEPKWLDARYPEQAKKVKRPCVALVSTDKDWIVFMKVRLDRVLRIDLGAIPEAEALAVGGKVPDFGPIPNWTAPYAPYAPGWWSVFVPKGSEHN